MRETAVTFQPACMTADEIALWRAAAAQVRNGGSLPCADCPLEFAATMRNVGRCNGEPQSTGRPRLSPNVSTYAGGDSRYATAEERIAVRRQQWREASRRRNRKVAAA